MGTLFVTAATAGSTTASAPVGGGVAVLEALLPVLGASLRDRGHGLVLLVPGARRRGPGGGRDAEGHATEVLPVPTLRGAGADRLLGLDERAYARFALEWEAALGRRLERIDPAASAVLANDVSEGPPFAALARRGVPVVVLWHVVVADFFARRYLRLRDRDGRGAAAAAAAWRALERSRLTAFLPGLLGLVWRKEGQAARHAEAVVPSPALAGELARCHPDSGVAERTHVLPWGVLGTPDPGLRARREGTLARLGVDPARACLLTLSRLSPEKRIELLLAALERLERSDPGRAGRASLVVAGAPAYMGGERYAQRLRRRAARLRRVAVHFVGYVPGTERDALLAAADLFCSTSEYEAYGLGIAQALAAGTPVLATDHQGARCILDARVGWTVAPRPDALAGALREALTADLAPRREAAARWGAAHPFRDAAARVAELACGLLAPSARRVRTPGPGDGG